MGRLLLVLGGARSGKSAYAQQLAEKIGGAHVLFVATAEARDADMAQRIAQHRAERPATWRTLEVTHHVGDAMTEHLHNTTVVVVDCVTLLVSNVLLRAGDVPDARSAGLAVQAEVAALVQACNTFAGTAIVVSNEVGLGLVPDNALGRLYRDLLGRANQALAVQADAVYFMVAGLPMDVKALVKAPSGSL